MVPLWVGVCFAAPALTVSSVEELRQLVPRLRFGDVVQVTETLVVDEELTLEVDPALQVLLLAPPSAPAFLVQEGRTAIAGLSVQVDEGGFLVMSGGAVTLAGLRLGGRPSDSATLDVAGGDLVIQGSRFEGVGGPLGVLHVKGGSLGVFDSAFVGNERGAVRVDAAASCLVERSAFEGNQAAEGGALWSAAPCTVRWSDFVDNGADRGGALFLGAGGEVVGGRFCGNTAAEVGGAGVLTGVELSSSVFHGNHALAHGVLSGEASVRHVTTAANTSLEPGLFGDLAVGAGLFAEPADAFGPEVMGWNVGRDGAVDLPAFSQAACPSWAAWVPALAPSLGETFAGALDACAELVHTDLDHDGAGSAWLRMDCSWAEGESPNGGDCDDTDPTILPGAEDPPGDGVDQDCTGFDACFVDGDLDGLPSLEPVDGSQGACVDPDSELADCDDQDPSVHPFAEETECDGIDQDCDGADRCEPATPDPIPTAVPDPAAPAAPLGLPLCSTTPRSGVGVLAWALPMLWLARRRSFS